ncbi:hypothetical protein Leryth_025656 [Lithospermum erythrorhizon]|nr:hypothetical protein Leryth_025656 [Lithospermum erythrorhizon]
MFYLYSNTNSSILPHHFASKLGDQPSLLSLSSLVMASEEVKGEPPQPELNYKKWVLRVSVHCEGCKKKVKKLLSQVPSVHTVDIDIRQQRVTVIGNVEADTLIKKLLKSGKNAELWPESPMQMEKKTPSKSKNREKQPEHHHQESQNNKEIGQVNIKQPSGEKKEDNHPPVKIEALKQPPTKKSDVKIDDFDVKVEQKSKDNDGASDAANKAVESNSKDSAGDHQEQDQSKSEGKKVQHRSATTNNQAAEEAEKSGKNVKKKKTKGQNGKSMSGAIPSSLNHHHPMPANESPPRDYSYHEYGLSYNTAYPTNSYATSHYAAASSYLYSYPSQQLDSFEIFSDENPNGCFVM